MPIVVLSRGISKVRLVKHLSSSISTRRRFSDAGDSGRASRVARLGLGEVPLHPGALVNRDLVVDQHFLELCRDLSHRIEEDRLPANDPVSVGLGSMRITPDPHASWGGCAPCRPPGRSSRSWTRTSIMRLPCFASRVSGSSGTVLPPSRLAWSALRSLLRECLVTASLPGQRSRPARSRSPRGSRARARSGSALAWSARPRRPRGSARAGRSIGCRRTRRGTGPGTPAVPARQVGNLLVRSAKDIFRLHDRPHLPVAQTRPSPVASSEPCNVRRSGGESPDGSARGAPRRQRSPLS